MLGMYAFQELYSVAQPPAKSSCVFEQGYGCCFRRPLREQMFEGETDRLESDAHETVAVAVAVAAGLKRPGVHSLGIAAQNHRLGAEMP